MKVQIWPALLKLGWMQRAGWFSHQSVHPDIPFYIKVDLEGQEVAIVYKTSWRISALMIPGLEAQHMSVGTRNRIWIVLVYRALCDLALSIPELVGFIFAFFSG